jgi:hypothetical protein
MDKKILISYLNAQIAMCNKKIKMSEFKETRENYRFKRIAFQKVLEFIQAESEILVKPPLEFYKNE